MWIAAEPDDGPEACRTREALWLELRQCFAGYGDWVPDLRTVGDCYVEAQNASAAETFYRRVLRSVPETAAARTTGGPAIAQPAVELRLLDCGFLWLAGDAGGGLEGRRGGAPRAVARPRRPVSTSSRWSTTDDVDGVPDLDVRRVRVWPQAPAGTPGFVVPAPLMRNAQSVASAVTASTVDASSRAISVELNETERRRALTNRDGPQRFLRMQACPFTRPHIGAPGTKYFIELNLATSNDRERAACRSPWSWLGRRLP